MRWGFWEIGCRGNVPYPKRSIVPSQSQQPVSLTSQPIRSKISFADGRSFVDAELVNAACLC